MKYKIEYESAVDKMAHTIEIEANSEAEATKKLVEKYKKKPSKILSCKRIEDMKKSFKIGNRTIKVDSVYDAIRINKLLDARVKDDKKSDADEILNLLNEFLELRKIYWSKFEKAKKENDELVKKELDKQVPYFSKEGWKIYKTYSSKIFAKWLDDHGITNVQGALLSNFKLIEESEKNVLKAADNLRQKINAYNSKYHTLLNERTNWYYDPEIAKFKRELKASVKDPI